MRAALASLSSYPEIAEYFSRLRLLLMARRVASLVVLGREMLAGDREALRRLAWLYSVHAVRPLPRRVERWFERQQRRLPQYMRGAPEKMTAVVDVDCRVPSWFAPSRELCHRVFVAASNAIQAVDLDSGHPSEKRVVP